MDPNGKSLRTPIIQASKAPKDGQGPRGLPEVYYTSRVLNSTGRYVRFVKKLRALEEEQRVWTADTKRAVKDNESLEFFIKCDRRCLINKVQNRVRFCLESYEEDLAKKRQRLKIILNEDEEENIRKVIETGQSGAEMIRNDRMERLKYLLAKREKEHEDLYSDTPLSKAVHVLPCITKMRAKEAEEIQLYQIREKQMRKEAEKEFDRMWYEVAMKESDALAARIEYNAMELKRRDFEAKNWSVEQLELKRLKRAKEQERLKQEVILMKAKFAEDDRKAEEEQRRVRMAAEQQARDKVVMIKDREETIAKRKADDALINKTWESLAALGLRGLEADALRRRQMERELDECNFKMAAMKSRIADIKYDNDPMIQEEGQRLQDGKDLERCHRRKEAKKALKANQQAIIRQMKEKSEAFGDSVRNKDRRDFEIEVDKQLQQLIKHKELTDAQARKLHQKDILGQIAYNERLKTSRLSESAAHYDKFIKKLRILEEENRIGDVDASRKAQIQGFHEFFRRCDHKGLFNQVECRVKQALDSYEDELNDRRYKVAKLFSEEDEHMLKSIVVQGQAGAESLWKDRMDRLAYLLDKRQKEHDAKYTETPLDKCTHLQPWLVKLRKKECQEVLKYQMREKQMRKESEWELDRMWYDLAMRESEALTARIEYETMVRVRRDKEILEISKVQIQQARQKRLQEKEMLKQQALQLRAQLEADCKREAEEMRQEKADQAACANAFAETKKEEAGKKWEEAKLMDEAWEAADRKETAAVRAAEKCRKQKEMDLDECNFKLGAMKKRIEDMRDTSDHLILEEARRRQDVIDLKRCETKKWSKNFKQECSNYNKDTFQNNVKGIAELQNADACRIYHEHLGEQINELVKHKELTDAQARKLHQKDILDQIAHSNLLKAQALQEEDQRKKCQLARQAYADEIEKMLQQPYFSEKMHPFLKQMAPGMKMAPKALVPQASHTVQNLSNCNHRRNNSHKLDVIKLKPHKKLNKKNG